MQAFLRSSTWPWFLVGPAVCLFVTMLAELVYPGRFLFAHPTDLIGPLVVGFALAFGRVIAVRRAQATGS